MLFKVALVFSCVLVGVVDVYNVGDVVLAGLMLLLLAFLRTREAAMRRAIGPSDKP